MSDALSPDTVARQLRLARRGRDRLSSILRRYEHGELDGRNSRFTHGAAVGAYQDCFAALVVLDDERDRATINATAAVYERLVALRRGATSLGLMEHGDVIAAEDRACITADRVLAEQTRPCVSCGRRIDYGSPALARAVTTPQHPGCQS